MPSPDSARWARYDSEVRVLSSDHPMLLLPVQMETRWRDGDLLVRVYPDDPHIDRLDRALSPIERDAARAIVDATRGLRGAALSAFGPSTTEPTMATAWRRWAELVADIGPWRAAWALRTVRIGAQEARSGDAVARMLPQRWAFVATPQPGADGGREPIVVVGNEIPAELVVVPGGARATTDPDPLAGTEAAWVSNFKLAIERGMAVVIPKAPRLSSLVVVGVHTREANPGRIRDQFLDLLTSHHYARGLWLVPPESPTNASRASATPGWVPDAVAAWRSELATGADLGRGGGSAPFHGPAGVRWARALGLGSEGVDLFARVAGAAQTDNEVAARMKGLPWWASWGRDLSTLHDATMKPAFAEIGLTIRQHLDGWVWPAGPLPVLGIGSQPYGLLPVGSLVSSPGANPLGGVRSALESLRGHWRAAGRAVPRLGSELHSQEEALLQLLSQQPWPRRFALRETHAPSQSPRWESLLDAVAGLRIGATIRGIAAIRTVHTVGAQRDGLAGLRALLDVHAPKPGVRPVIDDLDAFLQALDGYLLNLGPLMRAAGLDPRDLPPFGLRGAALQSTTAPSGQYPVNVDSERHRLPLLPVDSTYGAHLLETLSGTKGKPAPVGKPGPADEPSPTSMLDLLARTAARATAGADDRLKRMVVKDIEAAYHALTHDDREEVSRHLAGAISLTTTRLDAWVTSFAARDITDARTRTPEGILLGAWGYLEDLAPGAGPAGGYLLAPSGGQAATAAVLRSAHDAHADAGVYALDLSSRRVRLAREVFDGVAHGIAPEVLLGQIAERALHDAGLQTKVQALRDTYGTAGPVIDGVALARALLDGAGGPTGALREALAPLTDAYDAAADVGLYEATHHLLHRRHERVATVVRALDSGEGAVRDLTSLDTARPGRLVEHRVLLRVPSGGPDDRWAAGLLGQLDRVRFRTRSGGGAWASRTLPSSLGTLEMIRLSRGGAGRVPPSLRERLLAGTGDDDLDPAPPVTSDERTLDDLLPLLERVDALLNRARVPEAGDIPPAADSTFHVPTGATPTGILSWLDGVARVRPAVEGLDRTLRLLDAHHEGAAYRLRVVQATTLTPEERAAKVTGRDLAWAAVARPSVGGAWRCWVLLESLAETPGPVDYRVIDSWTERIPDSTTRPSIAFRWNAPVSRAPQLMLLAAPPKEWSLATLVELVRGAVGDATARLVEAEHLSAYTGLLPSIAVSGPVMVPVLTSTALSESFARVKK